VFYNFSTLFIALTVTFMLQDNIKLINISLVVTFNTIGLSSCPSTGNNKENI